MKGCTENPGEFCSRTFRHAPAARPVPTRIPIAQARVFDVRKFVEQPSTTL